MSSKDHLNLDDEGRERIYLVDGPMADRIVKLTTPGEDVAAFDANGTGTFVQYAWNGERNEDGLRTFIELKNP
ncbi:hypothetical protein SMC26_39765 [Actinomadura fulvescens]|uniref:Uncharacterized protein n=1 Tax=Actinomadura fulvescens TaxID=46160 RepID=A0ABP6DBB0_9ACTN